LQDVASDIQNEGLQTNIMIDRDTASRFGISTQLIDNTLYDAFGQRLISTLFTERNQYYVVMNVLPSLQKRPDALNNIYINSALGGAVPLSAFTKVSESLGPLVLNRQNQFPVA